MQGSSSWPVKNISIIMQLLVYNKKKVDKETENYEAKT